MDELRERILKEVKSSKLAFVVKGTEVYECFGIRDNLDKWTRENSLTYNFDKSTEEFAFAISPSLSAIEAGKRGMEAMSDIIRRGNQ